MERKEEPTWQPIGALRLIGGAIDAQLDGGRDQYETLLRARPYALDDAPVDRLVKTYGDTAVTCGSTTSSSSAGPGRPSPELSDARWSASGPIWPSCDWWSARYWCSTPG